MRLVALTVVALLLSACTVGWATGRQVVRTADLSGRLELAGYSVVPPTGDWLAVTAPAMAADPVALLRAGRRPLLVTEATTGHVFLRREADTSIFAAAITADARRVTARTPDGLLALKEAALRHDGQARFRLVEAGVSVDRSRPEVCVRFDTLEEDRDVPGARGVLHLVSVRGVTCLHPRWPEYAIELAYSQRHRHDVRPLDVSGEGEAFLRSLQFTTARPLHVPSIRVGAAPGAIAVDNGSVWVSDLTDGAVTRVDAATNQVLATVPVGKEPFGVAAGGGGIWVANQTDDSVSRIDPLTGRVVATIAVQKKPALVAVGFGAVWVTNHASGSVSRIDPVTNEVVATIVVGPGPAGVAAGEGAVWVAILGDRSLARVDPATNRVDRRISVGLAVSWQPEFVAVGEGSVWVTTRQGFVARIDPTSNRQVATTFTTAGRLGGVSVGHGRVWVVSEASGSVWRIDPSTNAVVGKPLVFEGWPRAVAAGPDAVWIIDGASCAVRRLTP